MGRDRAGGSDAIPFPNRSALRFEEGPPGLRALVFGTADAEGDAAALADGGIPAHRAGRGDIRIPAEVAGFEIVLRPDPIA